MNTTHNGHAHDFLGAGHDDNARRTLWVVILTVVMMVGEIAAGYITGSMALLADGFHMATHAGALGIAAAAYAFARKHSGNTAALTMFTIMDMVTTITGTPTAKTTTCAPLMSMCWPTQ